MTIHKMKSTTFATINYDEWHEVATQSLKGKPFDALITKTIEGVDLKPLYTEKDLLNHADETLAHITSSIRASTDESGWIVAQQQYATNGNDFITGLITSIERGNEAVVFDGTNSIQWCDDSINKIAELITKYPVIIFNTDKNDAFLKVFDLIPLEIRMKVQGSVFSPGWLKPEGFFNLRTIGVDTWSIHHEGADGVTELAIALAQAAESTTDYKDFTTFAKDFSVRFAVDTHFFMEMAKIRAFRVLWNEFSSAFGEESVSHVPILVATSLRSYSKLDPYVNLLRAGNEVFSAVLGGADAVTVHPHDVLTGVTPTSIRLARNVQLVIKEETHADKVLDPSGGSYFIENLTLELADKAWKLFLTIESFGGYSTYVESGKLAELLEQRKLIRKQDIAKGKSSLIGTNVYADLSAEALPESSSFQVAERLAEPFEILRMSNKEAQPKIYLVPIGDLKDFKPRTDFVSGFLSTGGIRVEWSPVFENAEQVVQWLATEKPEYVVVCASPKVTKNVMDELLDGLPKDILVDVAGLYSEEDSNKWRAAGLSGFIYSGQDKVQKLAEIGNALKGVVKK
ncbi:methylmalonyl-CoA mutase family protein [Sporosarcina sp. CAU 1771]